MGNMTNIYREINKMLDCGIPTSIYIYKISKELDISNYETCDYIHSVSQSLNNEDYRYCQIISDISGELLNPDHEYCEKIYHYMKQHNLEDIYDSEQLYKSEQKHPL
jgi:hypothetical protein